MLTLQTLTRTAQSAIGSRFYTSSNSNSNRSATMWKPIQRVTLFKIPNVENQKKLIEYYKAMPAKAIKDGKPYIKSITAGLTKDDQRRQGYTVAAISVFESQEDMAYYDSKCAAHAELKTFVGPVKEGVLVVYFENETLR